MERAKNRIMDCYTEKHHIKPKCMGGNQHPDNLVRLTAREHFLSHWLLHEIYPDNPKLRYAFWSMFRNSNGQHRYVPSSRIYEYAKNKMLEIWQKFEPSENQIISIKKRIIGSKWYHKPDGSNFRAFPEDPKIIEEGWILGRFNGKELSKKANNGNIIKYKEIERPKPFNKKCSIDGIEFESAKIAADFLNLNEYTLRWILQGRGSSEKHKEKYKNWYYIN